MLQIPNLPHPSAPLGDREEDAEVVKVVGEPPSFAFEPRDHLAIAGPLASTWSAARAPPARASRYLLGDIAVLWMALSRFAIDTLRAKGFMPVNPPVLVRREALVGTGFLPGDEAQIYRVPEDELFLVGTSEVSLAALHMGEILPEADLPLRYCGISTCYRREAGAAGRDTRGIFRTHQFEKVEMFSFCHPDRSWEEHEWLLSIEEEIAQALGLPLPRGQHRGRRSRHLGGQEVRHRGVAAGPGTLPRADELLEHDRLPGPPARLPDARRDGARCRCCTR